MFLTYLTLMSGLEIGKKLSKDVHPAFVKMGIDAILYINHYVLGSDIKYKKIFKEIFDKRNIKNIIFVTKTSSHYEIVIGKYESSTSFISSNGPVFFLENKNFKQPIDCDS